MIFILTGKSGAGKTTYLKSLITQLQRKGKIVTGVISPMLVEAGVRIGYEIIDIVTGEKAVLARTWGEGQEQEGVFRFSSEGLHLAATALENASSIVSDVVIIDEIGPLELRGGGFTIGLRKLLTLRQKHLLLVIRPWLVKEVVHRFAIIDYMLIDLGTINTMERLLLPETENS